MTATIRILYVDDETTLLDIGKMFLEKGGALTVDTLTSPIEALDQLKMKRYDAIISDYQMPDMDGITFLKQLKASGNKTPFIIFTGRGREEVVIEALNSGADFYIQKGGDPKSQFAELSHKIKTAVSRQKTEKLAKDTERRLYDIINFLPDATFAIDTDGTVIAWNKAIEEMTGVPASEMLGRGNYEYAIPFYDERRPILINLVSISDNELAQGKYAVIKKEGNILIAETTLPRPLGRYSVLLGKASLLYNDEGTAIGTIESIRDITEQKQVEAFLMKQEEQSRMLLSSMPDIVMVHHDGIIVFANQMAIEKTGYSEEELIGSHIFNYVKETDREIIIQNMEKRACGELVGDYEIHMIHKSGLMHHVIIRTSPIVFNQLPSIVFIIIDITERKRAEEALRESEEKYRLIFDNSPLGHLSFDEKGVIVACNDKFIQIIGSSRDALIGLNMLSLPDKNLVSAVQKALDGSNGLYEGVYSSVTAKKITPVKGIFAPINFRDGRIPGGMGIFEDITERKKAEGLLKESELKYRSLIESSSDAIFCVDENGAYQFTNLIFASTFDKTPEYFIGKTFWDIYPKEHADLRQLANLKVFETGEVQTLEVEVPLPDTTLYFLAKANPIKDETGKVILNLTHATDITDRKLVEQAIQQANQKLLLLSSITRHDINNQLTVLLGYQELVAIKQADHDLIDYCQKVITAAQRIYAMIQFTKEYESLGISAPAWYDTCTLFQTAAKQVPLGNVMVKNDIPSGNEMFADPLIIKVCYNLMENAVQYGKKITTIRFSVLKRNDEHLIVCEDDGDGVLAEEKEKIFERGFGKNTGLGLALSREILSITGITIKETGEPGKGARFELTVPNGMWRIGGKKEK
jgi:PAS domain S-box-containing protein